MADDKPRRKVTLNQLRRKAREGEQIVQMAIYEERLARSMRGKGPMVNKEDFRPGVKIDVYVKPERKDDSGWRGPAGPCLSRLRGR